MFLILPGSQNDFKVKSKLGLWLLFYFTCLGVFPVCITLYRVCLSNPFA